MLETYITSRPKRSCLQLFGYLLSFYLRLLMFSICNGLIFVPLTMMIIQISSNNRLASFKLLDEYYIIITIVLMGVAIYSIPFGMYGHYVTIKPDKENVVKLIQVCAWTCALTYLLTVATWPTVDKSVTEAISQLESYQKHYDFNSTFSGWSSDTSQRATYLWDRVQEGLDCCGLYSYREWISESSSPSSQVIYPRTCCASYWRDVSCIDRGHLRWEVCSKKLRQDLLQVLNIGWVEAGLSFTLAICTVLMYLLYPFEQKQQQREQNIEANLCYTNSINVVDLDNVKS